MSRRQRKRPLWNYREILDRDAERRRENDRDKYLEEEREWRRAHREHRGHRGHRRKVTTTATPSEETPEHQPHISGLNLS